MKILNFGSLNIDYVYQVEHFVRGGETLGSSQLEQFPGGKGLNQSVAFARAGAQVCHAGCIGSEGHFLADTLQGAGVDISHLRVLPKVSSGHAIIQVTPEGENCILLYGGANQAVTDAMIDEVLAHFGEGDWLMLQNEINGIDRILHRAKERGMTAVLNPSPISPALKQMDLSELDYLILNETEGCELTGQTDPAEITLALLQRYPNLRVVLTLGGNGSRYADSSSYAEQEIFPAKAVDTTAAGDTFTGYFFASAMEGSSPAEALRIASAASSITVSRKGAVPSIPSRGEVEEFLHTLS